MRASKRRFRWVGRIAAAALLVLAGARAGAYSLEVHKDFYDLAFPDGLAVAGPLEPPSESGLADFRRFLYELLSADPHFRARWPEPQGFDADAMKRFLSLNPLRAVFAIDRLPEDRGTDVRSVVREASVDPDEDMRNQDRAHLLPDGTVALDPLGRAVPEDPRTVWFAGRLFGPASQFDAHGATLRSGSKGQWLLTTLGRPEQYARPPTPLGSAPEFSESYAELAQMAKLWGGRGSEWLALTFAGHSLHGVQDLGNQIHATLIGSHRFYTDALRAYVSTRFCPLAVGSDEDLARFVPPERLTIGELKDALANLRNPEAIDPRVRHALRLEPAGNPGLKALVGTILGSHHRLLEEYVQERYLATREALRAGDDAHVQPAVATLIESAKRGDPDFRERAQAALENAGLGREPPGSTPFAQVLAEAVLEASAPEAAPLYEAIRAMAIPSLRQARTEYHEHEPPMDYILPEYREEKDHRHGRRIWELNTASFARVVTSMRLWFEAFHAETAGVEPGSPKAWGRAQRVASRLAARQMDRLRDADARRAAYLEELGAN